MKSNLISAIAGWKSAALLALVAMVAAVAFSGVLSTTQTADAQLTTAPTSPVAPGATVQVSTSSTVALASGGGDYTNWTIQTTGAAEATFVASGTGTLTCQDADAAGSTCDSDTDPGEMTVAVKISDDSGAGAVLVRATRFGGTDAQTDLVVLTVSPGLTPTSITLTPSATSISAAGGTSTLNIVVRNSLGGGVATTVDLVTTSGQISGCSDGAGNATTGQACNVATVSTPTDAATDGRPATAPTLTALASPGVATVTATVRGTSVSTTADITFFGAATGIEVASEQDALQVGGTTFVVVTVTDAAGSPVAGQTFADAMVKVTGPAIPSVSLTAVANAPKDVAGDATTGGPDGVVNGALGELPHCATGVAPVPAPGTGNYQTAATPPADLNGGTNSQGKCVLKVDAPVSEANPAANATRGVHTIQVTLSALASDSVEISVGGAPSEITSDAPARIDPSDEITVNITVLDDEGDRVGMVSIEVDQTAGDGKIITPAAASTVSGRASFTYLSPSTPGTAEFLVRTRAANGAVTAKLPIIVTIGAEPVVEEEPEGPAPTWNAPLASGTHNLVWNGEDGADPSAGAEGVSAIWRWTGDSWQGYFPDAAEVPGGNNLESLENGAAYWVIVE